MTNNKLDNMNGQEIKELINEQKISMDDLDALALSKLIDYETDLLCFGNGDVDLICQCSDRLDLIRDNGITDETVFNAISRAKADYTADASSADTPQGKKTHAKHFALRKIGLVAATIALILVATALITAAFGINIFEYLSDISRQPKGTRINEDGFTFYHNGIENRYGSMEEFKNAEKLDIMYPSELPQGVNFTEVVIGESLVGEKSILIRTNNKRINVEVDVSVPDKNSILKGDEIINNGDMTFCVFYEQGYFAYCYYDGNAYSIEADSYENLILIIKSFKE